MEWWSVKIHLHIFRRDTMNASKETLDIESSPCSHNCRIHSQCRYICRVDRVRVLIYCQPFQPFDNVNNTNSNVQIVTLSNERT
jgi:hypothetical protein